MHKRARRQTGIM